MHGYLTLAFTIVSVAAAVGQASAPASTQPTKLGRYLLTLGEMVEPTAAASMGEEILVADTGNDRIVVFDRNGKRIRTVGRRGDGPGEFLRPGGVAVDETGHIYVCDTGNNRLQVLAPDGTPSSAWGGRGRADGEFCNPGAIAVNGDRVAVVDDGNERVQVFNRAGKHLLTVAADDKGDRGAPLRQIGGVAIAPDGSLYVSDITHHRVLVFDTAGARRHAWGDWGAFPGQFAAPSGLALHGGDLFVADTMNHRVQVLTPDGPTRYEWGLHVIEPRSGEGRLHYPRHITVSDDGAFAVVCEPFENRCQVFTRTPLSDRTVARLIPGNEGTAAHFGPRADVSGGYLALTEPESHTLMLYDCSRSIPINITQIGGYGTRFGMFNTPADVKLDFAAARLYALDTGNRRLQMFMLKFPQELGFSPLVGSFAKAWSYDALDRAAAEANLEWPLRPDALDRDRDGNFYLLDARNCTVVVLDETMRFLRRLGAYSASPGDAAHLRRPLDLCVSPDGGLVLVADGDRGVGVFAKGGGARLLGGQAGAADTLVEPAGVALDPEGRIYVADRATHRVLCFSPDGELVRSWGGEGLGAGEFFKPTGVQVDSRGRVLVLDYGNHRGQYFSAEGEFLSVFGARFYIAPARQEARESR